MTEDEANAYLNDAYTNIAKQIAERNPSDVEIFDMMAKAMIYAQMAVKSPAGQEPKFHPKMFDDFVSRVLGCITKKSKTKAAKVIRKATKYGLKAMKHGIDEITKNKHKQLVDLVRKWYGKASAAIDAAITEREGDAKAALKKLNPNDYGYCLRCGGEDVSGEVAVCEACYVEIDSKTVRGAYASLEWTIDMDYKIGKLRGVYK